MRWMIFLFALLAAPALAQAPPTPQGTSVVQGNIVIAVTNTGETSALPATASAASGALTYYNSGTKDAFCTPVSAIGGVATTASLKIPAGTYLTAWNSNLYSFASCITGGSDTTSVTIYQGNGPNQFGMVSGSGGSGSGVTSFNTRTGAVTLQAGDVSGVGGLLASNNLSDVANAGTSRGNLNAAKSGANSDITSLTSVATINKVVITAPATGSTLTIPDGVTLNAGVGGTLGSNAFLSTTFAPLASPGLTGVPAAPTAAVDTNTTQIATTAYVVGQGYAKLVSPSFTTPTLGVAAATTINKVTLTAPATSSTLTIPDGVTLNAGAGGTLGSLAFLSTINNGNWSGTGLALTNLAAQASNTVLANVTAGSTTPTAFSVSSCSATTNALIWTTNTGFGCNSSINAATLGGATFAAPGAIGGTTAAAANFTTIGGTGAIGTTGGGSAATPGLYVGTTGYGLYEPSGSQLGVSVNGTVQLDYGITNTGEWTSSKTLVVNANGTVSLPALTVRSTAYGMYSPGTSTLGLTANGTNVFDYGIATASVVTIAPAFTASNATVKLSALATSSAAQTGTVCSGTGGLLTVDTTTTCLLSVPWLKDKHGAIDPKQALGEGLLLKPFWFTWKSNTPEWTGDKQMQPGLDAVQVSKVDKRLAAYDPKGKLHGVRYQEIVAFQQAEIDALQGEIKELQKLKGVRYDQIVAVLVAAQHTQEEEIVGLGIIVVLLIGWNTYLTVRK